MKKPRVVFTYVEAGLGHIVAATGVSQAFKKKYGKYCEVIDSKFFSEDNNPKLKKIEASLIADAKGQTRSRLRAEFIFWIPKLIRTRLSLFFLHKVYFRRYTEEAIQKIADMKPDLIFSAFAHPSYYAIQARKKYGINPIISTYSIESDIANAYERSGDLFFTFNALAYKSAMKQKHNDLVCKVQPILKNEIYNVAQSKYELRKQLNLPKDNFTIFFGDGAYAQTKMKEFAASLLQLDKPLTIIIGCGKNKELKDNMTKLSEKAKSNLTFIPLGFVPDILPYYKASDLYVGKSGPNTINELFYLGVPMIVSSYACVFEKINAKYFMKKKGYGEIIRSKRKFVKRINAILDNPEILEKYKQNMKEMTQNNGAETVADILFEKLKTKFPELKKYT